jgi:hypothetical protein
MKTLNTIFKAIGLALGVAVVVLSILETLAPSTGMILLGLGLAALGIANLQSESKT